MPSIAGVLCLILATGLYLLSFLQFRRIGPPLNNSWLFASTRERAKMDTIPLYRQSGTVFSCCGTIFLLTAIAAFTQAAWLSGLAGVVIVGTVIFAIASSVRR